MRCVDRQYNVVVYGRDLQRLGSYRNSEDSILGVQAIRWSSSGQFLAIAGFDSSVSVCSCHR